MDDGLEQQQDRLIDKAVETSLAYWNALLSVNGILITVFSAVAIFGRANVWCVLALVAVSFLSSYFLIMNFKSTKNFYKSLGAMPIDTPPEEIQKASNETERARELTNKRETRVERLLFIQAFIITLILFTAHCQNKP